MDQCDNPPDTRRPTRESGLARLGSMADTIRAYALQRNYADAPTTSRLSPYLRRRLLLEEEVLAFAQGAGSFEQVEKFVQEVVWRTYWKGWLEARPGVWWAYLDRLRSLDDALPAAVQELVAKATAGLTDLPYFNAWVDELVTTGFLHNHIRMWFASVWVFTLKLPWELGARFFLDHLLDGDPASNTLSWRWVAGLQTPGKHYLARAENITKYTNGRFVPRPGELDESARPIPDDGLSRAPAAQIPLGPEATTVRPRAILLHDEDLGPLPDGWGGVPVLRYVTREWLRHTPSPLVKSFNSAACADADTRAGKVTGGFGAGEVAAWCRTNGATEVWAMRPFVGFTSAALAAVGRELSTAGVTLRYAERGHDLTFLRHATKGFFPFWATVGPALRRRW